MVNIFSPHTCPIKSAKALDSKRLARMCYESFEVMSSVLLKLNIPQLKKVKSSLYRAPIGHFNHPVVNWVLQDSLHFEWTLKNAQELNEQYFLRYKKEDNCKPFNQLNDIMVDALQYLPKTKYPHSDLKKIEFGEFFNYNHFKSQYNKKYEGDVVLDPEISVQTRYRLYLLHKWLYLDARNVDWGGSLPPVWAFNPIYRDFLRKHFGKPVNKPDILKPNGSGYVKSLASMVSSNKNLLSLEDVANSILNKHLKLSTNHSLGINSCAIFDKKEKYRYFLSRQWSTNLPLVVCMLNPSTADAFKNDPTVQIIENLAKSMSCGGFVVINFAALRATDPKDMIASDDPDGNYNLSVIRKTLSQIVGRWRSKPDIVLAYGNNIEKLDTGIHEANKINKLCAKYGKLKCFKMTKRGFPQHPLYLSRDIKPGRYLPW